MRPNLDPQEAPSSTYYVPSFDGIFLWKRVEVFRDRCSTLYRLDPRRPGADLGEPILDYGWSKSR